MAERSVEHAKPATSRGTIPIPDAPLYLNKHIFHQVVLLELVAGGFGPVTSSNAVEVTIGAF